MKKQKYLKYILFTFIAIIASTFYSSNVKAETIVCDYDFGEYVKNIDLFSDVNKNKYENLLLRLQYNNGIYSLGFYNRIEERYFNSTSKESMNGFVNAGLYINHLSVYDIKNNYDFSKTKKCPSQLFFKIVLNYGEGHNKDLYLKKVTTGYFGDNNIDTSLWDNSYHAIYLGTSENQFPLNELNKLNVCANNNIQADAHDKNCGVLVLSGYSGESKTSGESQMCEYGDISLLDGILDSTTKFSFKFDNNHIYDTKSEKYPTINFDFEASSLNGKCPKTLYTEASKNNSGQSGTYTMYLNKKNDTKMLSFGLITTLNLGNYKQKSETDLCESGAMKYVEKGYSLLRFLIPVIIIVVSTIDFAGVVLSGKEDNMEKAKKHFITRIVVGMIILFIPFILEVVLKISGIIGRNNNLVDFTCGLMK